MGVELVTQYQPYVDELFTQESKKSLVTNQDLSWTGAHTIKVYKIGTADMQDYDRAGTGVNNSRYGVVQGLDATTEEFTLRKDRSFTFAIDKLDTDETGGTLAAASALARQMREKIIPEVDKYTYQKMAEGAGYTFEYGGTSSYATFNNVYALICDMNLRMDNMDVPENGRVLLITPTLYRLLKKDCDLDLNSDIGTEIRLKGVIATLDGVQIVKVPEKTMPVIEIGEEQRNVNMMLVHPCATVAPIKLESYKMHQDPPGINGDLVEGRVVYDAFVLDNKKNAIVISIAPKEDETTE